MKGLVIIGASGFGMEVAFLAKRVGREIVGFLDDTPEKQGTSELGKPILGQVDTWKKYQNVEFVVAVGNPRARKSIVEKMITRTNKPKFATLVDPSAIIGNTSSIDEGTIICAGVVITEKVVVGRHTIINLNSTIGHECNIGDFVTIAPIVAISGNVRIKSRSEIGTSAAIREKLEIGTGSVVGMGATVTKNIDPLSVSYGSPAKTVKKLKI